MAVVRALRPVPGFVGRRPVSCGFDKFNGLNFYLIFIATQAYTTSELSYK